jgi:uncharacterized membrane protein
MPQIFPHPNATAVGFINNLRYIDSLTDVGAGGLIGVILMIVILAVLFLIMKAFRSESAFIVASFITAVLGILIRILLLTNDLVVYISIILFCISLYLIYNEKQTL